MAEPRITHPGAGAVWAAPAETVIEAMGSDPMRGLTSDEAAARLAANGPNVLRAKKQDPAWLRLLRQFADPLIYLLLAAIAISLVVWVLEGADGIPVDATVIAVIVVANAIVGYVQEAKAEQAVAALAAMTATMSSVMRDGDLIQVPSPELVPGDVLVLAEGDAVGADARLFGAASLHVQEAALTGESVPVDKRVEAVSEDAALGDRTNMVFKGTAVTSGVGRAVVVATGMSTQMGGIATLLDETLDEPTPLQIEIARISKLLGLIVIGIALVVMATMALVTGVHSASDAVGILLLGVSLAVAAVPEGLPAILSLVLALGVQAMARRNAVMKDLHSVETLGATSVICTDKTGTLTRGEMTLREVVTASGRVGLDGVGYDPAGQARLLSGRPQALDEARVVIAGGSLANNASLVGSDGEWQIVGDPTEAAFLVAGHKLDGTRARVASGSRVDEVPFTSDRKLMSVLCSGDEGERVITKGAPEVLLGRCTRELVGAVTQPLDEPRRKELREVVVGLNEQGYRTLGVAERPATATDKAAFDEASEADLTFLGLAGLIDPPRTEASQAIREAHRAGIRTVMITGDHPVTAARIAADLGLVESGNVAVVTGTQLDSLGSDELSRVVDQTSVFARVSPRNKLQIVEALRAGGLVVAMTGDGVNDAPALKAADIGIAMGNTGTAVTKEAAQMVLADDNYATIISAVRRGRIIFYNIRKFMRYLLSSNMGEVATVFLAVLLAGVIGLADPADPSAAVVPLLATQLLWINLVTDSGPALAMGVDPEISDVMARPPRRLSSRIIDRHMWARILSIGLLMGVLALVVYDLSLPGGLLGGLDRLVPVEQQLVTARTSVFTALVFMQLFNALSSRADSTSAFAHLFTNGWLWTSLALATLAQVLVVQLPALQTAFGTTSLDAMHWLVAIGCGVAVLAFEEASKLVRRTAHKLAGADHRS